MLPSFLLVGLLLFVFSPSAVVSKVYVVSQHLSIYVPSLTYLYLSFSLPLFLLRSVQPLSQCFLALWPWPSFCSLSFFLLLTFGFFLSGSLLLPSLLALMLAPRTSICSTRAADPTKEEQFLLLLVDDDLAFEFILIYGTASDFRHSTFDIYLVDLKPHMWE